MKCRSLGLIVAIAAMSPLVPATPAVGDESVIITQHQIQIAGKPLRYTAETGRVAIRDVETGEPHAYIFYTAYRVPSPRKPRPVTFVWNGGPGSDSALLHFKIAGPKRAEGKNLIDNSDTWLGASDLVFVDPVGTGFSRPTKAEYAAEFYGTLGDTASVTEFVRCWRLLHDANDAPTFLVGESWGAGRAATVGYALERRNVKVDGLVLISGGTGLNTDYCPKPLQDALRVVDVAVRALYYGKTPAELGKDPQVVRSTVEDWARHTYAPALAKADELTDAERTSVIGQLSRFTGMPADKIDRKTLAFTPRQFLTDLLADQGRRLQTLDTRKTVAADSKAAGSVGELEAAAAILRYLRQDLGYRTDLPYVGLESLEQGYAPSAKYPESVNERWNYATAPMTPEAYKALLAAAAESGSGPPRFGPPLPATLEALGLNPRMKVLVASGVYDSYASCAISEETARRLPPFLQKSINFKCYDGGHMMYLDPPVKVQLSNDVKAMIEGAH